MFKRIRYAAWFISKSKDFTGHGYIRLLFKEHLIRRTIWYVKQNIFDEKMEKKYGTQEYYLLRNRIIEVK